MLTSSEIFIISVNLLILVWLPSFINSVEEGAYGQLSDPSNNGTYFLDNDEEQSEDDSSEIMISEKGVFERIEGNSTGDD